MNKIEKTTTSYKINKELMVDIIESKGKSEIKYEAWLYHKDSSEKCRIIETTKGTPIGIYFEKAPTTVDEFKKYVVRMLKDSPHDVKEYDNGLIIDSNISASKKEYIKLNAVFTQEAADILGVGKTQVNNLVKQKKLIPIKQTANAQLFLVDDVFAYKNRKLVIKNKQNAKEKENNYVRKNRN